MSQTNDPSEHPSQKSSESAGSDSSTRRPRTNIEEHESSDSDAPSQQVPSRSVSPLPAYGPATRYGLRCRVTARKSVPIPIKRTFHIPSRDDAGPSRTGKWSRTPTPSPPPGERTPIPRPAEQNLIEQRRIADLTSDVRFHGSMLGHHDRTLDSLVAMMGASSQATHRVINVLEHTMASVHQLYIIVYLLMAVLVIMIGWLVLRSRF